MTNMREQDGLWYSAPPPIPPLDERLVPVATLVNGGRRVDIAVRREGELWRVWIAGRPSACCALTFPRAFDAGGTTAFLLAPPSLRHFSFIPSTPPSASDQDRKEHSR